MKEIYEKLTLTVTHFDVEDVITTSAVDKNNAYRDIFDLGGDVRDVPTGPWN